MNGKILFISHEASRTGAPIVLLHFLKWLKANTDTEFVILLKWSGELLPEFKALAPTYVYQYPYQPLVGLKGKVLGNWNTYIGIPVYYKKLKKQLLAHNIGLIYANGIGSGPVLNFLSFLQCRVVTHIHELKSGILANGPESLLPVQHHTTHYIAASNAVKEHLLSSHNVQETIVDVIHEFVPAETEQTSAEQLTSNQLFPADAFVVGASGTIDMRKGADLFVPFAQEILKRCPSAPVYLVWVGGNKESLYYQTIEDDIIKAGLQDKVRFIGAQSNPWKYFRCFNVMVLLSREDPYPLVCLEAALLGKPVLCFARAGGMPEFVENDCGYVVPYLDISTMADKVVYLLQHPQERERLGRNAREKVLKKHTVSVTAPRIQALLHRVTGTRSQPTLSASEKIYTSHES